MRCLFAVALLVVAVACQSLAPIPHAELEAMINEAVSAAQDYDDVVIAGFGIRCNPPSCENAFIRLGQPAPEYEAAMGRRFNGRIVFEYGYPSLL